jgi:valyl-tRNA synthetase
MKIRTGFGFDVHAFAENRKLILGGIEKYGADSLRFMLITGNTPGNDIRFQFDRLESSSNFANKIWNASRFVLMNLEDYAEQETSQLELADKWIISRFNTVAAEVNENIDKYELGEAGRKIYEFIWNEFCDWYIEIAKISLYDKENIVKRQKTQKVLRDILQGAMELLHPVMPFITEEIWQHLPGTEGTIMKTQYPLGNVEKKDKDAEGKMNLLMDIVRGVRNIRSEMGVPPSKKATALFFIEDKSKEAFISEVTPYLKTLAALEDVKVLVNKDNIGKSASAVVKGFEIFLPLEDLIDLSKEVERLEKEIKKLESEVERIDKKLSNQGFVAKAPEEVIEKEKEKRDGYLTDLNLVRKRLDSYK